MTAKEFIMALAYGSIKTMVLTLAALFIADDMGLLQRPGSR